MKRWPVIAEVPRAGWLCALVAILAGTSWALLVPPFQVPDEPAHFAYTQYLAEAGEPPRGEPGKRAYSQELRRVLDAVRYKQVEVRPDNRPLASAKAQRGLERALETSGDRESEGGSSHANNNQPVYYAIELAPYWLVPSGNLLDRLFSMRLLSALLSGITVLFVFLFLRELLPGIPWAWPVGALAVALQPVFGNISGAIHSDNLLYAASAAVFLMLAVCFRRGLTAPRGAALGLATSVGILTKPTMLGLVPGIALGLALLVSRAGRDDRTVPLRGVATALLFAALPVVIYGLLSLQIWDRGFYLATSGEAEQGGDLPGAAADTVVMAKTLGGYLEYVWQFYLPRLPFMEAQFDQFPLAHIWFDGFVGRFGALEYGFGTPVDAVAICVFSAIVLLAARELVRNRSSIRTRLPELITYMTVAGGTILFVHKAGYDGRTPEIQGFEQARYLFPMLALYAALIALAARGAGRRFGPTAGVLIVSLAIAHTLLALLLTLTRYYG